MAQSLVLNKFDTGDESAGLCTYIHIHIHMHLHIYVYIYILSRIIYYLQEERQETEIRFTWHRDALVIFFVRLVRRIQRYPPYPSTPSRFVQLLGFDRSFFLSNATPRLSSSLARSEHATAQRHHPRVPFPSISHANLN